MVYNYQIDFFIILKSQPSIRLLNALKCSPQNEGAISITRKSCNLRVAIYNLYAIIRDKTFFLRK